MVKCPKCRSERWVGILNTMRREEAEMNTCFCKNCCIEFVVRNGKLERVYRVLPNGRLQQIS